MRKANKAFSIIELSILITAISIATVAALSWTSSFEISNGDKYITTNQRMLKIIDAIIAFRTANGRLPCPAVLYPNGDNHYITLASGLRTNMSYNTEATINTTNGVECVVNNGVGTVPTKTLGLLPEMALDGWGHMINYNISPYLCLSAQASGFTGSYCNPYDYQNNTGNLTVSPTKGSPTPFTTTAAIVLVSTGADGYGAIPQVGLSIVNNISTDNDEIENYNQDTKYVKKEQTSTFDDIVMYRTKNDLESNHFDPGITLVTSTACTNNSNYLSTITSAQAVNASGTMRNEMSYMLETDCFPNGNAGCTVNYTFNNGDEAVLDLMWVLQEACYQLYGTTRYCPAGATIDHTNNYCYCQSGNWSGGAC